MNSIYTFFIYTLGISQTDSQYCSEISTKTKSNIIIYTYNSESQILFPNSKQYLRIYKSFSSNFYSVTNYLFLTYISCTVDSNITEELLSPSNLSLLYDENVNLENMGQLTNKGLLELFNLLFTAFPIYFSRLGYADISLLSSITKFALLEDFVITNATCLKSFQQDHSTYSELIADIIHILTEDNHLTIDAFLNLKEVSIKELCISSITKISSSTCLRSKFPIVRYLPCFSFLMILIVYLKN